MHQTAVALLWGVEEVHQKGCMATRLSVRTTSKVTILRTGLKGTASRVRQL